METKTDNRTPNKALEPIGHRHTLQSRGLLLLPAHAPSFLGCFCICCGYHLLCQHDPLDRRLKADVSLKMINPIKFWRSLAIVQGCILVAVIFVSFHYYSLFKGARYWLMDRACWTGDVHGVEILLSFGASPDGLSDYIDSADHHGVEFSSHLSQAAYEKHKEIVAILLKHGANPNVLEGEGWTAIKSAARANDIEVAKMLLSAGADPDAGKGYGSGTAVDVARTYKSNDVERLLEDYKNKNTANKAEERDTAR